ncbi:HlyD family secretion protein [Myxococcus sp. CA040A]|uniref:HlyD family secretion protein n=1 Tax=Myxococcus sp. CA040A TaxID=2741738 RepID=UPI00157B8C88|nr:HlyD family efflux transporter periplasmic adaptor subunit [Myxococcus sp. CA040A]NTX01939.1 HlyD family efflux transporter periplasmic adaptor subunit [Myxococcus sp. CA040A]
MAYPFERTLRSLSYESDTRLVFVALMVLCAGGLIAWSLFAKVPLVKASSQARIEPHNAVHRIEPPSAGRVVLSMLKLDHQVKEGDLLIEFDARAERLELERSKATLAATEKELAIIRQQITNKREEAALTARVDEVAVKEVLGRAQELVPRHRLAVERAELAIKSPTGAVSEMEKLERKTDVDALSFAQTAQGLALTRLQREQNVRRQALAAQLLGLEREELGAEGRIRELRGAIDRLEYQIERKLYRAPATGHLVDVAELGSGAFIADGQRVGTIVASNAEVRVRARFPKEVVGLIQPGQTARLKLDGYPNTIYGTVPARVTAVGTEPGQTATPEAIPGTVRVELKFAPPDDPRIQLRHGMTLVVEVEVARASPVALLMRALGEWNPQPEEPPVTVFQPEAEAR